MENIYENYDKYCVYKYKCTVLLQHYWCKIIGVNDRCHDGECHVRIKNILPYKVQCLPNRSSHFINHCEINQKRSQNKKEKLISIGGKVFMKFTNQIVDQEFWIFLSCEDFNHICWNHLLNSTKKCVVDTERSRSILIFESILVQYCRNHIAYFHSFSKINFLKRNDGINVSCSYF